jgi:hypothetical protein
MAVRFPKGMGLQNDCPWMSGPGTEKEVKMAMDYGGSRMSLRRTGKLTVYSIGIS